jgi:phosphate transport system protein
MSQHLHHAIGRLKKMILMVGTLVEESLRDSIRAFLERDATLAKSIIEEDASIDRMEVEVEEECLKILALHQPVAVDLRFIVSVLKINNDLERIGDLAVNIAERMIFLSTQPSLDLPRAIPRMAEIVQGMLRDSLDALVNLDVTRARQVQSVDDEVDRLHSEMYPLTQSKIAEEPEAAARWLQLLGVSRYLERAADHCTNIAEDVEYLVEGEITRHHR